MGKFTYEAHNEQGQLVKGEVQAANETAAEQVLNRNKLVVTRLDAVESPLSALNILNRVSGKARAQFARQLATMIDAGLPLVQALNIIYVQTKDGMPMKKVISSVIKDVESGYSFSTALARHPRVFDRIFISIAKSGEATGKLDKVLLELADQLEKDVSFNGKIRGAMAYPLFVISAMIGVAILMMIEVIPTIKGVFASANAQLPWATLALIAISDFMVKYWYWTILGLVVVIAGGKVWFMTEQGKEVKDWISIKAPIISSTSVSINMARLTRMLGLLVGSGIPILEALQIVSDAMNNGIYRKGLEEVRGQVERGVPMSVPLMKNTNFPIVFGQMVAVGEQTGRVDTMLDNLARYYSEDADNKLKSISSLIEPLVMVILGVGVAILIFAIFVPIYSLSTISQ